MAKKTSTTETMEFQAEVKKLLDPVRLPAEAVEARGGDRGIAGQAGDLERRLGQRGWQLPCQ